LGGANAIGFQPTGNGKAAITGDFLVTGSEVNPLIRALRAGDIEVTAISQSHARRTTAYVLHPLLGQRRRCQAGARNQGCVDKTAVKNQ